MSDLERDELEALAAVQDVEADALIDQADADFADLAKDAAAELEQDLELEQVIEEIREEESAVEEMTEEGAKQLVLSSRERWGIPKYGLDWWE